MADQDNPEEEATQKGEKSKLPEGRRVVRKKRRSSSNRETIVLSNREILGEMIEPEPEQAVNVRDQVDRLRRAQKEQKKSAGLPMEDKWGSREHRRKGSRWLPIAIFLIVVPLLVFVIISTLGRPSAKSAVVRGGNTLNLDEEEFVENQFAPSDPVTWFHENSVKAFDDCIAILDRINQADTALQTLPLMRQPTITEERMQEVNFEWGSKFEISDPREIKWEFSSSGDVGYMVIWGKDSLFSPFRAYFVKTREGVKMDWAATTGWSELPVVQLTAAAPKLPVFVRCWLVKKPHFDSDSNQLISWYQILSPDKLDFVWAYTPIDSEVDRELKQRLNYGKIVMDRIEEMRMILRLRVGGGNRHANEFELIEFVAEDWIQP